MEAEVIAMNEGAKEAKCVQHILQEMVSQPVMVDLCAADSSEIRLNVNCDSSSAVGFARRKGLGRVKHLELRWLWIQEEAHAKRLTVHKVDTTVNLADLFTKEFESTKFAQMRARAGMKSLDQPVPEPSAYAAELLEDGGVVVLKEEINVVGDGAVHCPRCGIVLTCQQCQRQEQSASSEQRAQPKAKPRARAESRAAALRGELSYGYGVPSSSSSTSFMTHVQAHTVNVAEQQMPIRRAPAEERTGDEAQRMSRPTVRQLDFIRVLLMQRGLGQEAIDTFMPRVTSKSLATSVIAKLQAGLPVDRILQ